MAKNGRNVIIDDCFDPDIVTLALTYILKPKDICFARLSTNEKYGMMLFGARYGLPPEHVSRLIDRSIYGDLVQYAWEKSNLYLMEMLPKVRIPEIDFLQDFKKVDEKVMVHFVPKYVEHDMYLEEYLLCLNKVVVSQDERQNEVCAIDSCGLRNKNRSIYADLVQYAWERQNKQEFFSKYLEHGHYLKTLQNIKSANIVAIPIVWLALCLLACLFGDPWHIRKPSQ
uniref:UPF0481 protein At3g47200-like n=1 Tax=Panagrellus redivivus TaxID=6233 RepID=A0A7E4VU75_PANRE